MKCNEKEVWLEGRSEAGWIMNMRKINDDRVFVDNRLLVELLEFSNDLYSYSL